MGTLGDKLGRILIPIATPFHPETQDVNYVAAARLVDCIITRQHCDSIIVAGTSGEFNTLTLEERRELFACVQAAAAGRVPLVAGACAGSTREAVQLAEAAEALGYDALMVVGPYYCKPTQEGIYRHFATVARATSLPVMLYNIPIFTGMNVEPATVARLAELPNIVGIKDEAGINPTQMTDYRRVTPPDFTIYNGDDIMVLCGLAQGAAGVVSGGSILIGPQMRRMIDLFLAGCHHEALQIHLALDPFFKAFCQNGRINPIPIWKAAMNLCGLEVGPPRLPLDEATPGEVDVIRGHLVRLGVLDSEDVHA
jgi:4-hydroxy-tetrahydrodipicolinate synthase